MKSNRKFEVFLFVGLLALASVMSFLNSKRGFPRQLSEEELNLEFAVASIPIGLSGKEVESIIGSPPDSSRRDDGILMNPAFIFTAESEQGLALGEPQPFTFQTWKRGQLTVSIAVGADGNVAAKLSQRNRQK